MNSIIRVMACVVVACCGADAAAQTGAGAERARIKSPEDTYRGFPNRLADIPPGWATTKPLRLEVCFNLRFPANSPEADAFLKQLYQTITALPYGVQVRIERPINPVQYAYCASMFFKDWQNNREYEYSDAFLKYYREVWKPAVTEATEQLSVLDDVATSP